MFTKKKIYYLIYEIEYRDFLPRLFISLLLTQKDSYVFLLTFNKFKKIYNLLPKGIVLFQNLGFPKKEICEKILVRHKGCLLHEEPLQVYENYIHPSVIYDKDLLKKMEFVSCISKEHKMIIDKYCNNEVNTIVHGFPKMELSNKNYKYLFKENIKKIKKKYKDIIFVPSNFHFATYRIMNKDKYWYDKKIDRFENNFNSKYVKKYIKYDQKLNRHKYKVLKKFITAINAISDVFPDHTFIVRPHPGDHPLFWKKNFKKKNINVVFEYDVKSWIYSSKLTINHWCASSIEAYFQNKNAIGYLPNYNNVLDENFFSKTYEKAYNLNSLIILLKKRLSKQKSLKPNLLKKYIAKSSNSSINLISRDLYKIDEKKNNILFTRLVIFFLNIISFLFNFFKSLDQKEKEKFKWPNKSISFITKKLIKKNFFKATIKKIGDEIYLINNL